MSDQVISDQARLAATAIRTLGKDATEVGIGLCIDAAFRAEPLPEKLERLLSSLVGSIEEAAALRCLLVELRDAATAAEPFLHDALSEARRLRVALQRCREV